LFGVKDLWSSALVAYSLIRPKSQNSNIRHDGTLKNFMLILEISDQISRSEILHCIRLN
jgi:hypothetical protein